ncbi:MAG: nucleotidyltransferase family protein [Gammaproteobacteria bacterium]|nr:nucleotidyltransferase family protein [Gammaproteobacteria bacterium]
MNTVSAILLAAGESRRMGEINKLELMVDGKSLLRRTAETLLASDLKEIVVVVGHEANKTRAILEGLPVRLIENEAYREGQMTSVYKGLLALEKECHGVMICLSDQPLLQAADVNVLINAFGERSHGSILVPTFSGQRGNPIIFDYRHRQAILNGERNLGCKKLIEKNPQQVCSFEMNNNHVVVDLDTPEQYAVFTAAANKETA